MPGGDRTGPRGLGAMTGRGLGWCADDWPGGGFGGYRERVGDLGWGRGRGWRSLYNATGCPGRARAGREGATAASSSPWTPQDELNYLKDYIRGIEEALNAARARMAELERTGKTD
jgi:hypothetical protein